MALLVVRLSVADVVALPVASCGSDEFYMEWQEALDDPCLMFRQVERVGSALLPEFEFRVTYVDDDGDACTLTDATARDALEFVRLTEGDPIRSLQLEIAPRTPPRRDAAEEAGAQTRHASCAVRDQVDETVPESPESAPSPSAPIKITKTFRMGVPRGSSSQPAVEANYEVAQAMAAAATKRADVAEADARQKSFELEDACKRCRDLERENLDVEQRFEALKQECAELCGVLESRKKEVEDKDVVAEAEIASVKAESAQRLALVAEKQAHIEQLGIELHDKSEEVVRLTALCNSLTLDAEASDARHGAAMAAAVHRARAEVVAARLLQREELLAVREAAHAESVKCDALETEIAALKDALAFKHEAAEKNAREHARRDEARRKAPASATVIGCSPLIMGTEAEELSASRGDATPEFAEALARTASVQAFRVGRVRLGVSSFAAESVPVCAKATIMNNGRVPWPETAAVVVVDGSAWDMPLLPLGAVMPREAAEVDMDLKLPPSASAGVARSMWAVVDAATGGALGPLLVFEAEWTCD